MRLKVTLSDLIDDGELDGFSRGARYNALTAGIEEEVCAAARCPWCGHEGLEVASFLRPGSARRAFAVCPTCHGAQEF